MPRLSLCALLLACPGGDAGESEGGGSSGSSGGTDAPTTHAPTTGPSTTGPSTTGPATTGPATDTGDAESSTGGPADEESVTLRAEACEKSPPAATRCDSYEVVCGGLAPAIVDLAIYEGDAGVDPKGTILFGSGGEGTGFYNFSQAKPMIAAGYTLVDRRWPAGWFTGGTDGPQQAACRLAAVIRHLRASPPAPGPLCATGNSGGSAELVYALTWQGAGDALDFALPTSGPFHRLDLACQGASDPDWPGECDALRMDACPDCMSQSCQLGAGPATLIDKSFAETPRCTAAEPGDLPLLADRSPALGPDVIGLGLPVRLLIGKDDDGAYAPLTIALHLALAEALVDVDIAFVAGAPHEMDTTPEGGDAIREALLSGCVLP